MSLLEAYFLGVASTVGLLLVVWLSRRVLGAWAMGRAAAVPVGFAHVVGMRIRGTDPEVLVGALVVLAKSGEPVAPFHLEALYLTLPERERNVEDLVRAARTNNAFMARSDPAPERRHVPKGKPPQAAQWQESVIRRASP